MTRESPQPINLLELKPSRNVEWEMREGDLVVLHIPKFRNRFMVKWFVPMLAKPRIRVNLDALGSAVWKQCDGATTVAEIGQVIANGTGDSLDAAYERIGKFVQQLVHHRFLLLDAPAEK